MKLQSGIIILKESLHTMSTGELQIANFILDNPEKVMELNISDLAAQSGGSPAGIVRLCKRLNMKGYNELKLRIAMDLTRELDRNGLGNIKGDLSPDQRQHAIVENHINALKNIETVLDEKEIKKAAKMILSSGRIDIYGLGASAIVAGDFHQKLCRLGLNASFIADGHMQITSACSLSDKDAFLAISYSGETRELLKAAEQACKNGASSISLTRYGANSLEELCSTNLFTPMNESLMREAAMTSRIAQLTVVDILFSAITSGDTSRFKANLDRTRLALMDERN